MAQKQKRSLRFQSSFVNLPGRSGGLVLVRLSPNQLVLVQALARDITSFLGGKTPNSHSASLHPGVEMGTRERKAGG